MCGVSFGYDLFQWTIVLYSFYIFASYDFFYIVPQGYSFGVSEGWIFFYQTLVPASPY